MFRICHSDNGWTDSELGRSWIEKDFDALTKEKAAGRTRILIMDGHSSHYTPELLRYAKDNNIVILGYPPHCTHALQGLDVVCFACMKKAYQEAVSDFEKRMKRKFKKADFTGVFGKAFLEAFTPETIKAAFEKTGVYPFNPNAISAKQMRPSEATSLTKAYPLPNPSPVAAIMEAFRRKPLTSFDTSPSTHQNIEEVPHTSEATQSQNPVYCMPRQEFTLNTGPTLQATPFRPFRQTSMSSEPPKTPAPAFNPSLTQHPYPTSSHSPIPPPSTIQTTTHSPFVFEIEEDLGVLSERAQVISKILLEEIGEERTQREARGIPTLMITPAPTSRKRPPSHTPADTPFKRARTDTTPNNLLGPLNSSICRSPSNRRRRRRKYAVTDDVHHTTPLTSPGRRLIMDSQTNTIGTPYRATHHSSRKRIYENTWDHVDEETPCKRRHIVSFEDPHTSTYPRAQLEANSPSVNSLPHIPANHAGRHSGWPITSSTADSPDKPSTRIRLATTGLTKTAASFLLSKTRMKSSDQIPRPVIEHVPSDLRTPDWNILKLPNLALLPRNQLISLVENLAGSLTLAKQHIDTHETLLEKAHAQLVLQDLQGDKLHEALYAKEQEKTKGSENQRVDGAGGRHLTDDQFIQSLEKQAETRAQEKVAKQGRKVAKAAKKREKEALEVQWKVILGVHEAAVKQWEAVCADLLLKKVKKTAWPAKPKRPLKPKPVKEPTAGVAGEAEGLEEVNIDNLGSSDSDLDDEE